MLSNSERKARWWIYGGGVAIALGFAAYTQHAWEDYYITYRISKNLATGHGLVYTIGQRVHGFTSPFNVLIPAGLSVLTGNHSDQLVLWLFRIVSSLMLAGAAVLLYDNARKNSLSWAATAVMVGMFALDPKIVDFSINGQEVAFMMFFLALALHAFTVRSEWTTLKLGLAGAGLMWTRPDGFVYLSAIGVGVLLFGAGRSIGFCRLGLFKKLLVAAGITTVLYLPWLLWAWHYYGSPVPHTIVAKGLLRSLPADYHASGSLRHLLSCPIDLLRPSLGSSFLPAYYGFGGWHWVATTYGKALAALCVLYWIVPSARPQARAVSFAFMLGHFYLSVASPVAFPWYAPNVAIMGIFVLAHMVQHGVDLASGLKERHQITARRLLAATRFGASLILAGTLSFLLCCAYQMRVQQREIEDGTRKRIGLWLKENATSPNETVFLEPLGYIGFYSQLKMLDSPGLCSAEVVAAEKRLGSMKFAALIPELRADWLVLRPGEVDRVEKACPGLLTETYTKATVFDSSERIASYHWLPGRNYCRIDSQFTVFKRNKS